MTRIEETRSCGVNCGRAATALLVTIATVYAAVCLGVSLVARLYLKMYYCAAHVAAMATFGAIFIIVHHVGRVRWALALPPVGFYSLQVFLNFCYCGSMLAAGVAYSILTTRSINDNYDHLAAAVIAFSSALLLGYILGLSVHILTSKRSRDRFEPDHCFFDESPRHSASEYDTHFYASSQNIPMETKSDISSSMDFKSSKSSLTSSPPKIKRPRGVCAKCLIVLLRILYWIFYVLINLFFVLFFVLTAYYPCAVIRDVDTFRLTSNMYTVRVPKHKPIALHMMCTGKGPETVLYENGLAGTAYATWSFIPQFLAPEYRVCVYDRRGYGWSETYENDYLNMLRDEPQWSKTNVEFLRALVEVARIQTPFYLAGHSYGGHHLLYTALEYPELLKGLIFLDSSRFNALDLLENMLEIVANFQATGLLSVVIDNKLFDYEEAFSDYIQISEMPQEITDAFLASMKSASYFLAYLRENEYIDHSREKVYEALGSNRVDIPALVIDAGGSADWFPAQNFPKYNRSSDYIAIDGATHEGLTLTKHYGNITAIHMREFMKRVKNGYYN